jgi:hypothetical protein
MKQPMLFPLLLGSLLTGSPVVADDARNLATGNQTTADARRVSAIHLLASATEVASATTTNLPPTSGRVATNALPPLPPGVADLKFNEFFRQPIGPRGLEYTDRLRSLEGRRIRILGYMVRQDESVDHCLLLSPVPQTLHVAEYGLCDDLPATTVHVLTDKNSPAQTPFTPGLMLLTGTLHLGNRLEADGRTSTVRLQLDPPTPEQKQAAEQALAAAARNLSGGAHAGHAH